MTKLYPIILSGGSGSRLWPLSRRSYPKQLLSLDYGLSFLQETARRVVEPSRFHPLTVIANAEHRFIVAEQLREVGTPAPRIVLEPTQKNTAPAVALAAVLLAREDPDATLLVMPADHVIEDVASFQLAVAAAAAEARLVLFGVPPSGPQTSYGYIRRAPPHGAMSLIEEFVEKPQQAQAETLVAQGWFWNCGIFVAPVQTLLGELARYAPDLLSAAHAAVDGLHRDMDFWRLDEQAFAGCGAASIDQVLMEKTDCAFMAHAQFDWRDVDAWSGLWTLGAKDENRNVVIGDSVTHGTQGSYLRSEGPLIAPIGVHDLVVVATPDVVLITPRDGDPDFADLLAQLKASKHAAVTQTRRTYRPWGWYESLASGARFQVKRIAVYPGARLSLQKHAQRAEHWVVVDGAADVHLDGSDLHLHESASVYIPCGAVHRLSNPGETLLVVIEVQSGSYLGEDDIVRLEDLYARV
jgi:mannose-1-phosphate guanylyltransferase/mannose-6-phosphate isomerase